MYVLFRIARHGRFQDFLKKKGIKHKKLANGSPQVNAHVLNNALSSINQHPSSNGRVIYSLEDRLEGTNKKSEDIDI